MKKTLYSQKFVVTCVFVCVFVVFYLLDRLHVGN